MAGKRVMAMWMLVGMCEILSLAGRKGLMERLLFAPQASEDKIILAERMISSI